ncbi:MAG: MvaI/BcnI restriction endonuclease family protein [Lachnospiraceae bacterium]|nr:MvaI/BcnI restriction endonuclease family protein [Lachnospiraceae bacterium]
MISTIEDFIREYRKIQDMGWITTHRSGNTGVGKTLEDLLGIEENNYQEPDFGEYELKASRCNSNSMLTLFTKSPLPKGANTALRLAYGYASSAYDNDEKVLHATLNALDFVKIANTGHKLKVDYIVGTPDDKIVVESESGYADAYWIVEELRKNFENKYPHKLVYVKAESKGSGNNEQFHFKEAYVCDGFSYDGFLELLKEGRIYVDLRIGQYPDGRTHDHGTGFRIREADQDALFKKHQIC